MVVIVVLPVLSERWLCCVLTRDEVEHVIRSLSAD